MCSRGPNLRAASGGCQQSGATIAAAVLPAMRHRSGREQQWPLGTALLHQGTSTEKAGEFNKRSKGQRGVGRGAWGAGRGGFGARFCSLIIFHDMMLSDLRVFSRAESRCRPSCLCRAMKFNVIAQTYCVGTRGGGYPGLSLLTRPTGTPSFCCRLRPKYLSAATSGATVVCEERQRK